MLKNIILFCLIAICAVGAGCQSKPQKNCSKQILRLNLPEDPNSFDPRIARRLRDLTISKQLFEGLTRLDAEGIPQPAIAEKIAISEDGKTYTFTLKETVWSNGDSLTAFDFETSWLKVLDPNFPCDYAHMLFPIKNAKSAREGKAGLDSIGILAIDDKTLVVHLESPTAYFLELLAFPTYFPVHPIAGVRTDDLVSNGPFQLICWEPQKQIVFTKNPLYWDAEKVRLDGIQLSVIGDNNTENQLFAKGELDWLGQPLSSNIPTDVIAQWRKEGKLNSYPVAGTFWFKFNTEKSPFHLSKLRKAFSYAIDRQEIITHILQGNQSIATGPLPGSMALNNAPYFQDGDLETGKKLFAEALEELKLGAETFPEVLLIYNQTERNQKIVQHVQQKWQNAFGIKIKLEAVEIKTYHEKMRQKEFEIAIGDWIGDFNDPVSFLELFKYRNDSKRGNGMNDTQWENEEFIRLLDLSSLETNGEKRSSLLHEAEKILVEEMPIAPVYHYSFDYLKKEYVKDVVLSPLGIADFKCASLES